MSSPPTTGGGGAGEKGKESFAKKDLMVDISKYANNKWEKHKPYEVDPPATSEGEVPKYFITFPYPYMNGMLHLGHGFSLSKSEFAARFWRLKGKRVLWPFGLHVTGTPIAACAQKISNEMKKYGCPPVFPAELFDDEAQAKKKAELAKAQAEAAATGGAHHSKKGKQGPAKPQWLIMKGMGLKDEEIAQFADPKFWLEYFPKLALVDLKAMGCHVDYRRSFITTNANPFYNKFIEWQFRNLRAKGCVHFGKRHAIFSPLDGQPCQDHDRASGEGVLPQEYTVVKVKVQNPLEQTALKPFADQIGTKDVVLPGATLRPETVVGQTNCWVSPNFAYKAFEVTVPGCAPQIWLMTVKAARNMAFQDILVNGTSNADIEPLFEVPGEQLIGIPLAAPEAPYTTIYALPMATITESKGTGVVMSVPSDSPDDYINLKQLIDKPDFRKKLNLKDEWVLPFPVVSIIDVCDGDLGTDSAKVATEKLKVQGPKDADKLEEAKKMVYTAGFYQGVMITGPFKGEKVSRAKVLMAEKMKKDQTAITYQEPMKEVMSRSGDACVVALCDQWYIEYGKKEWKAAVADHIKGMDFYHPGILNGFTETLEWLSEWPCSRTFGLGTALPFADSKGELIDSLSDSTIYMSYYCLAKYVHSAKDDSLNLDGTKPNKYDLTPEMFNDDTFDFIYRGVGTAAEIHAKTGIPAAMAEDIRREFNYWYPVDLRVSGKDLIQNHLTMFLYNHAAMWDKDQSKWPRSIYCNGHVQVDGEKMSKSKGNFITLRDALVQFTPDAMRLAIADAGDSLDDANFVRDTANGFILKLASVVDFYKERQSKMSSYRTGSFNLFDKIFDNAMNRLLAEADHHYSKMQFRGALNTVFFELAHEESKWGIACGANGLHQTLVQRYLELFAVALSPLAPHLCEYLWGEVLQKPATSMVVTAPFPTPSQPIVFHLFVQNKMISDLISEIRIQAQKNAKKKVGIVAAHVYAAEKYLDWQQAGLKALLKIYQANNSSFPKDTIKQIQAAKESWLTEGGNMQDILAFIAFQRDNTEKYGPEALALDPTTDDVNVLKEALAHICHHSGVPTVIIHTREDESMEAHKNVRVKARPGQPAVTLQVEEQKK